MKALDEKQLLFPQSKAGKFLLYSCRSKIGEISLPSKGITYFPPEHEFSEGKQTMIFRIRFDFADGSVLLILRKIIQFLTKDPWRHRIRMVIPGDNPHGYEVEPHGNWKAWFFDDIPQGYGPLLVEFISCADGVASLPAFSDALPWVVE